MTQFSVGAPELNQQRPSGFGEFVSIVKGRSVISAGLWDSERLELGLSGGLMLRVFTDGRDTDVNVISTVNPEEIPPIVVALGDLPQQAPLNVIVDKLNGLRTLHAIYFLVEQDRTQDLIAYLRDNPDGDIERDLIAPEDRLFIESMSYGSWMLAVWTKTKNGFKAISSVAGLVFERGRDAYLQKMEAEAKLLEHQANRESVQLAKDQFDLQKTQMDYLLQVSDQIDAPEIKEKLKARIISSVDALSLGDPDDHDAGQRLLE